ncbi:MAG: glycosyltransferase family 4 protein [Chitinophagaceae bacterium]|nr:glycosyltransferase family 4 protein [Chitinophagaceae bacterium]
MLDYRPNLDALNVILHEINPLLLKQDGFRYKIIISGKRLPEALNALKDYADKNIIYTGFTEDITTYLEATDIFLNPVQSGGGIKTKMVEAIGYGATVISTKTGAAGIERKVCGQKLVSVPDNDWEVFAKKIIEHVNFITNARRVLYLLLLGKYCEENHSHSLIKISCCPLSNGIHLLNPVLIFFFLSFHILAKTPPWKPIHKK